MDEITTIYNKLKSISKLTPSSFIINSYKQPKKLEDKITRLNTDRYLKLEYEQGYITSADHFIIDEENFTLRYNDYSSGKIIKTFSCSIDKLNELLKNEDLMITRLSDKEILRLKKKKQQKHFKLRKKERVKLKILLRKKN